MIGSGALGGSCRRQHAAAPISVARRPHTASPAGHLVPGPRMIARLTLFWNNDSHSSHRFEKPYRSLAEEMPPQFEVNSLNFNLVAV
jgi:hypothetical protein